MPFIDLETSARDDVLASPIAESITYKILGAGPGTAVQAVVFGGDLIETPFEGGSVETRRVYVSRADVATVTEKRDKIGIEPEAGGAEVDFLVLKVRDRTDAWWILECSK